MRKMLSITLSVSLIILTFTQVSDARNFKYVTTFQHVRAVRALAFSPDGTLLASAEGPPPPNTGFPTLNVWHTVTHERMMGRRTVLHRKSITSVAFSPDGRILVSASVDGNICAWEARRGEPLWFIENAHEGGVQSLSFSADSTRLVTGGRDNAVRLWDVATQRLLNTLTGHTDWVLEVATSRGDSRVASWIASASRDHTIRLWNLQGENLGVLRGHTDFVTSVGFAATGQLVSASRDMTIRSWDPRSRTPLRVFRGHTDYVHQVAVHAGIIASPSADGTVRLWALHGDGEFQTLTEHTDVVRIAAFSPNARVLASGDERGDVVLWQDIPRRSATAGTAGGAASIPAQSTVPHSIELVKDNRVVERGDSYRATFVVRNVDGTPIEGAKVKLSLGQWVYEPVGILQFPRGRRVRNDLGGESFPDFVPDHVLTLKPGEQAEEIPIKGWRVKPIASDNFNTALTNNEGKAECRQKLHSEGEYGVSATVLQNGQEFLTTSFSTGNVPNTKVIRIPSFESTYTRESDGWRKVGGWLYQQPPVPAYRVRVIPRMQFSCGVDLVDTSIGVTALEKYPGMPGLTSPDIIPFEVNVEEGESPWLLEEWINPIWKPEDTVANESRDLLILTVAFLNGDDDVHTFVENAASEWSEHANVKFDFFDSRKHPTRPSDIRIQFDSDAKKTPGGWSLLGRRPFVDTFVYENRSNPKKIARRFGVSENFAKSYVKIVKIPEKVTMGYTNLATFIEDSRSYQEMIQGGLIIKEEKGEILNARGLVLHEFGHALGLHHEHVNPDWVNAEGFEWNEEFIKKNRYRKHSPGERQRKFDNNFGAVSEAHTFSTPFDEDSVMLYPIHPEENTLGLQTFNSNELSDTDTYHIKSDRFYGPSRPVIKLEGSVYIKGEIYEDARGGLRKAFGGEKWESIPVEESIPVTVFISDGRDAVKIARRMHNDSKRTFNLYLGAVRATSEGNPQTNISVAIGAGFRDFDVADRAKKGELYGFTPCKRMPFVLSSRIPTPTTSVYPFTTMAENTGGSLDGFLEKIGKGVAEGVGLTVAIVTLPVWGTGVWVVTGEFPGTRSAHVPVSVVAAACEREGINLHLPKDSDALIPTYDGAADRVKFTISLTAERFQTFAGEKNFVRAFDTAQAAPSVTITVPDPTIPQITTLLPNYPNPFNPETWIPYHLATPSDVTITIYAIDGTVVRHLDLGHQDAGFYRDRARAAYWDGRNGVGERVASGIYFYTLVAGDFAATQKMLILK